MRCKKCKCEECSKPHEPQVPYWVSYALFVISVHLIALGFWVSNDTHDNKIEIEKIKNLLDNGDI